MKYIAGLILLLLLSISNLFSQDSKYWIVFTDKSDVQFDPYEYFDSKAIDRRIKSGIDLYHETDYPVKQEYISEISQLVDSVNYISRWLNAMFVYDDQLPVDIILSYPFVKDVYEVNNTHLQLSEFTPDPESNEMPLQFQISDEYDLMRDQLMSMEGDLFVKNNITGRGVRVAVFDVGFNKVDVHPAFEHIRGDGRILKTWDFVGDDEDVYKSGSHGRMVLSNIAGVWEHQMMGLAVEAEFILARTEISYYEPYSEEENWLKAAEWADKNGADIINSSLGYTHHRYFYKDMNGETSLVTLAAKMAARKGILVVNAMGNEGSGSWKYLAAPADADSILSIGGIAQKTGVHVGFSSYGPTADRRLKPNVCAYGEALVANKEGIKKSQGTSFATPLVTGFAACVLQMYPDLTNMELFQKIQEAAYLYPYFDYAHGYGVPKAGHFLGEPKEVTNSMISFKKWADELRIYIKNDTLPAESQMDAYLFYHIQDRKKDFISSYKVVKMDQSKEYHIDLSEIERGCVIRVFYRGELKEFEY